ncbi:MAG TPA: DNA polymerase III subunit delta [Thermohalobaculum sp.]|nr:DNA polymerase III subunit delta [Thermohalobaculum sp.]
MKLAGARAAAFCARPDARLKGALIYGPDGTLVALRRQELVQALTGGDDLRLTRIEAGAALRDPAGIDAALRARGFFPGRRVVLIEGAGDALSRPLAGMLPRIEPDDAFLLVTAGGLAARAALRRLFETDTALAALAFYPAPPDAAELDGLLAHAGLEGALGGDALAALGAAAQAMDRGALMQLIETIAVYAIGRAGPLGVAELAPLLPASGDSELDRLVAAVAEGRAEAVGPLMSRLTASGAGPVAMLIAAARHFRLLLGLRVAPEGIGAALGRLGPQAFGPRREALTAQARRWDPARLEAALRLLFQTDRRLRSPGDRPDRALVERCLIRLAMMAGRS